MLNREPIATFTPPPPMPAESTFLAVTEFRDAVPGTPVG
jgi:hypothetical protein